jgi:hypothetical protein
VAIKWQRFTTTWVSKGTEEHETERRVKQSGWRELTRVQEGRGGRKHGKEELLQEA